MERLYSVDADDARGIYGDGPLAQYRITDEPVTDMDSEARADNELRRRAHQPADIDRYTTALAEEVRSVAAARPAASPR